MYVFYHLTEQRVLNIQANKIIKLRQKPEKYLEAPPTYNAALSRLYPNNVTLNDLIRGYNDPEESYLRKLSSNFNMIRFPNDNLQSPFLNGSVYKYIFEETAVIKDWRLIYQNSIISQNVNNPESRFVLKFTDRPAHPVTSNRNIRLIFHPQEPLIITTQRFSRLLKTNVHLYARMKKKL